MRVRTYWLLVLFGIASDIAINFIKTGLHWTGKGIHLTTLFGIAAVLAWSQRRPSKIALPDLVVSRFEELSRSFDAPEMRLKLVIGDQITAFREGDIVNLSEKALRELSQTGVEFLLARELVEASKQVRFSRETPKWTFPLVLGGAFLLALISSIAPFGILIVAALMLIIGLTCFIIEKVKKVSLVQWQLDTELAKDYLALQVVPRSPEIIDVVDNVSSRFKNHDARVRQVETFLEGKPREPYSTSIVEERMSGALASLVARL